jgi:hypothetical protein
VAESNDVVSQIKSSFDLNRSQRLIAEIQCIRRPKLACEAFYNAAYQVAGFQRLEIQLLDGFDSKMVKQSISRLPKFLSKTELQTRFKKHMDKLKWVHAEMRMSTYLLSHGTASRAFPYLGISKKTCLLCGHMIQNLGRFLTRGNHGKVYSQWTLPSSVVIPDEHIEEWQLAIRNLQDALQREAAREDLPLMQAIKESTISTPVAPHLQKTSVFTSHIPDPQLLEREAVWLSSPNKRGAISEYVLQLVI